jgi:hypothetical protein
MQKASMSGPSFPEDIVNAFSFTCPIRAVLAVEICKPYPRESRQTVGVEMQAILVHQPSLVSKEWITRVNACITKRRRKGKEKEKEKTVKRNGEYEREKTVEQRTEENMFMCMYYVHT